jgi:hypothetical protein
LAKVTGGASSGANGGSASLVGGETVGAFTGGAVFVTGGAATVAGAGIGGAVNIAGGSGNTATGTGGAVLIDGGQGGTSLGNVQIGTSSAVNKSGTVQFGRSGWVHTSVFGRMAIRPAGSPTTITGAAQTITPGTSLIKITAAADVTFAGTVTTAGIVDGTLLFLFNSSTRTITFTSGVGNVVLVNGTVAAVGPNETLTLMLNTNDAAVSAWYEVARAV